MAQTNTALAHVTMNKKMLHCAVMISSLESKLRSGSMPRCDVNEVLGRFLEYKMQGPKRADVEQHPVSLTLNLYLGQVSPRALPGIRTRVPCLRYVREYRSKFMTRTAAAYAFTPGQACNAYECMEDTTYEQCYKRVWAGLT